MESDNAKKIVVASFFESVNLGDLLIADVISKLCEKHGAVTRVGYGGKRFTSRAPNDQIQEWWQTGFKGPKGAVNSLGRLRELGIRASNTIGIRSSLARWRRKSNPEHKLLNDVFGAADLLVLGGGNLLYDLSASSRSDLEIKYFADLAEAYSVPMIALGIGIGPFVSEDQARRATVQLSRSTRITFRDQASLRIYESHGGADNATVTLDPVFGMPAVVNPADQSRPVIALNVVSAELSKSSVGVETYEALIRELLREFPQARLPVFSTDMRDYSMLDSLVRKVNDERCVLYPITSIQSYFDLLKEATLVIGSRMHALILAFTQSVPFLSLIWQPKVREFASIVECDESAFDVRYLHRQIKEVLDIVHYYIKTNAAVRESLINKRLGLEVQLQKNDSILQGVVEEL